MLSIECFTTVEAAPRLLPFGRVVFDCGGETSLWVRGELVGKTNVTRRTGIWTGDVHEGDTIGVSADNTDPKAGCHLSVDYTNTVGKKGTWRTSGTGDWRVKELIGNERLNFKQIGGKGLQHCHWPVAVRSKDGMRYPGVHPVWAKRGTRVAVRTMPGIPNGGCSPGVLLAGAGRTTLYINGKRITSATNPHGLLAHVQDLKAGDVIAIHAAGGALTARIVTPKDGELGTKQLGRWRAAKATKAMLSRSAFAQPGYKQACGWAPPVQLGKMADESLLRGYAPAVWAMGATSKDGAVFRMVVGGECTKPQAAVLTMPKEDSRVEDEGETENKNEKAGHAKHESPELKKHGSEELARKGLKMPTTPSANPRKDEKEEIEKVEEKEPERDEKPEPEKHNEKDPKEDVEVEFEADYECDE